MKKNKDLNIPAHPLFHITSTNLLQSFSNEYAKHNDCQSEELFKTLLASYTIKSVFPYVEIKANTNYKNSNQSEQLLQYIGCFVFSEETSSNGTIFTIEEFVSQESVESYIAELISNNAKNILVFHNNQFFDCELLGYK